MGRYRRPLAVILGAALLLAACGDDDVSSTDGSMAHDHMHEMLEVPEGST